MRSVFALVLIGCAASPHVPPPARRLGGSMIEMGMRFSRAGKAASAGRWELVAYDLDELDELYKDDLAPSTWHGDATVAALGRGFATRELPALHAAAAAHDVDAYRTANAAAVKACNDCHKQAKMAFIEVPEPLGADVPAVTAPLAAPRAAR